MTPSTNQSMQNCRTPFLSGAIICFGISGLVAGVKVASNRGYGAGDLLPFFIWTLPFAGVIALTKGKLTNSFRRLPVLPGYALAAATGIGLGLLWTYIVAFFVGAWFSAFSFPVLTCWIIGGASGMIAGAGNYDSRKQSVLVESAIVAALSLGFMTIPKYLFDIVSSNQKLELVSVKWKPGSDKLTVRLASSSHNLPDNFKVSDEKVGRLKSLGLVGEVAFNGGSGPTGRGEPASVLIVMQRQLKEPVELRQPDGVEVIYVQGENGWEMYPADAPTLPRTIRLWADEKDPTWATRYSIERVDGSQQGGTLLTW